MIAPTPAPAPILPASPLMPFALDRLRHRGVDRIAPAADRDLIERDRQAALAVGARRLVDRADDAAQRRARGNQHVVALIEIDHRRRGEAILDLRGVGAQLALEAHVDLLAGRHFVAARRRARPTRVLCVRRAAVDAAAGRAGTAARCRLPVPVAAARIAMPWRTSSSEVPCRAASPRASERTDVHARCGRRCSRRG